MIRSLRLLLAGLSLAAGAAWSAGAAAAAEPTAAKPARPGPTAAPSAAPARLLDPAAAWRSARWGMTVEEVLKAFPGEAARLEPAQELPDGLVVAVGIPSVPLAGKPFQARFLFQAGKLALVSLRTLPTQYAEASVYEALEREASAQLGPAAEVAPPEPNFDVRQSRWISAGTALDLKYLKGAVVLLYHPVAAPAAR